MSMIIGKSLFAEGALVEVRRRLGRYGFSAKKSWGQNFLVDDKAYQTIVDAAHLDASDLVVEIGAGLGTLSSCLLQTGARVVLIEKEQDMCHLLSSEFAGDERLTLRQENALLTDYAVLAASHMKPIVVVGNLPYQIASQILFRVLEARASIRTMIFMLQKEVADRLVASPDTGAYGALSAQVQMLAQVRRLQKVGAGGFLPPPRVHSALIILTPYPGTKYPVTRLERYREVVQVAFSMRRKMLKNTLRSLFLHQTEVMLHAVGIDPSRRAETLSVEEFVRIADWNNSSVLSSGR